MYIHTYIHIMHVQCIWLPNSDNVLRFRQDLLGNVVHKYLYLLLGVFFYKQVLAKRRRTVLP